MEVEVEEAEAVLAALLVVESTSRTFGWQRSSLSHIHSDVVVTAEEEEALGACDHESRGPGASDQRTLSGLSAAAPCRRAANASLALDDGSCDVDVGCEGGGGGIAAGGGSGGGGGGAAPHSGLSMCSLISVIGTDLLQIGHSANLLPVFVVVVVVVGVALLCDFTLGAEEGCWPAGRLRKRSMVRPDEGAGRSSAKSEGRHESWLGLA